MSMFIHVTIQFMCKMFNILIRFSIKIVANGETNLFGKAYTCYSIEIDFWRGQYSKHTVLILLNAQWRSI